MLLPGSPRLSQVDRVAAMCHRWPAPCWPSISVATPVPRMRRSAAALPLPTSADLQLAGAAGLVDEHDAVAGVVDAGLDVDVRQRVDSVDHVADRLRFARRPCSCRPRRVAGAIGDAKVANADAAPWLSDDSSVARLTCCRRGVPLLTFRRRRRWSRCPASWPYRSRRRRPRSGCSPSHRSCRSAQCRCGPN